MPAGKPGEAIQIGDGITVPVVEIRGKQVRLGLKRQRRCWFTGAKFTNGSAPRISKVRPGFRCFRFQRDGVCARALTRE